MFVDPLELPEWPPMASGDTLPNQTDEALRFIDAAALDGPVNITTPSDMCLFFSMLMNGEIVNPHVSQEIFATLEQQKIGDRFPMLLPEGTRLVHKTGNLESVVHDVGIIYGPDGPVLLAAMAEGQSDDDVAYLIIQRLAAIAYGDLDVLPITASPVGGSTEPPLSAPASVTPIPSPSP
jgi:beta-lactamase class A